MIGPALAALLALSAGAPAAAGDAPPLPEVALEPAFVVTAAGPEPLEDRPLHPGETVGLVLRWPEGSRPERPRLTSAPAPAAGRPVPRRLVPADPRAGGADVLEVLLVAVGEAELAPVPLASADGRLVARTRALSFEVQPELGEEAAEPGSERPPVPIPLDPLGLSAAAGLLLLLIAGAVWLALWLRRRETPAAPAPAVPPEPPDRRALAALARLRAKGWHESGLVKPFCIELAEIGKGYLGEIAGLPLLERTTAECPGLLRAAGFPERWADWCGTWLRRIDLVKFAGDVPDTREMTALLDALERVIHETRELPAEDEPAAAAGGTP